MLDRADVLVCLAGKLIPPPPVLTCSLFSSLPSSSSSTGVLPSELLRELVTRRNGVKILSRGSEDPKMFILPL